MVCSVLPSGGWRGARGNGPSLAGARVRGAGRGGLRGRRPHGRGGQELHGVRSAGRARRRGDRAPHGIAGRPAAAFGRDLRVSSRDHRRADRGVRGVHRNGVHRDPEPRAARGSGQRLSRGRRRVCAALRAHLGQAVRVRQHVRDRRASAGRRAARLAADLRRRARRAPLEGGVRLRVPGAPGRLRRFGAGVRPEVRRAADGNGARPHLPRSRRRQGGPDRRQLYGRRHPGPGPRGLGNRSPLLPSIRGGAGGPRGLAGAPPRDRSCPGRAGREDLGRRDAASQRARGRGAPGCRGHRARLARPDPAVSARIIRTYYAITALFNLAMSLIWGIDTLFKLGAGLDIFHVMLTNAAFTLGSMVFEIPTGVVADTVGRRISLLLCLATLFVTTLLYVGIAWRGGGFLPLAPGSVVFGLRFPVLTRALGARVRGAPQAAGLAGAPRPRVARGPMLCGAGVDGVISSLVGLSLIAGNALVAPVSGVVRTRTGVLMVSVAVQAASVVLCGLLTDFYVVVALYLVYGAAVGLAMPMKQAYLNAHIPTAQRATIISLDSMFANAGGVMGQSGWGWLARVRSIGEAWAYAGATLLLGLPFYWVARRNDRRLDAFSA